MIRNKIVAIDFDGTITENSPYPIMGKLREHCKETIDFIRENNTVVLWTCRSGQFLQEACNFLRENEIVVDSVNCIGFNEMNRKITADIFIDDRNIFCKEINWFEIEKYFSSN